MDRNIDNNVDNNIIQTEYSELMQKSYIDYAMSVIIARALPDVRDGLKPVQRRTLYDMHELGIRYDKPYRKSARIVGDTMGKYHPHGDSSIYDAMVVLAQDFKKGMPLIDGHGNFGSIEGDGAAAMRYTEARLQKITQEAYLADLDKNVVDFIPNYDETEKEPEVLPVKVPNLLINGAEGIAVGMATSIPPHNFGEVVDGVIAYMKNPDITTAEMMQYIKGPDFPTGGIVANQDDLAAIYETGQGKIKIRGRIEIEKGKAGKDKLVITEIPYTMIGANIGKFLNDVYSLVESKATTDIVDITNQSSKEGIRIVLELKKGADVEALKNLLYKKTKLEDTFGVNMLAVANGRPETLGLVPIIRHHVNFQYEIAKRKYETLLANVESGETISREPVYVKGKTAASHGAQVWGSTYAEVDLTNQKMWYVKDGEVLMSADVVTGLPKGGRSTPAGVYTILERMQNKVLRGNLRPDGTREYETPVKYWMRVTYSGVGFHDATWQSSFGGNVYTYRGSHGCINMSYSDAGKLYELIQVGDPVIMHYYCLLYTSPSPRD